MNRRDFLRTAVASGAFFVGAAIYAKTCIGSDVAMEHSSKILSGIQIIDSHAHPDMDYVGIHWTDPSSSYRFMQQLNMAASSFSAVGDMTFRSSGLGNSPLKCTQDQLNWWLQGIIKEKKVALVQTIKDIPRLSSTSQPLGAILSIEGGDALEGRLKNVEEFYSMGVRIITLMHFHNNEIGDIMKAYPGYERTAGPFRGGLSDFGRSVIEKMEDLGMVVDVAHAHPATFRDILSAATKPVIDSHTNPSPTEESVDYGRMRTWKEMESVARNGGVVCTWPMRYNSIPRTTIMDWAKEILLMKRNLGIEHVGLGTDGGGYYRPLDGYHNERDLNKLGAAMLEVGLSREDIVAYMGGNVLRVLKTCMG